MATCVVEGCKTEARIAIRTERRVRAELKSVVWYDERAAPLVAMRYCREHGAQLVRELVETLVTQ